MELHGLERKVTMAEPHHDAVVAPRGDGRGTYVFLRPRRSWRDEN